MNNGYTTIVIGGETVGLKYGLPAVRQITEKLSGGNLITGNTYNEVGIAHILYAGYINNCIVKEVEAKHKFEFFYDFIEEIAISGEVEGVTEAIKCFEESRFVKALAKQIEDISTKKKNGRLKR